MYKPWELTEDHIKSPYYQRLPDSILGTILHSCRRCEYWNANDGSFL